MRVIGLVGCMGAGKGEVARILSGFGAIAVDADELAHQAYVPGTSVHKEIVEEFGREVVSRNGEIDRRVLGAKVFTDLIQLRRLEEIVWPHVGIALEKIIMQANIKPSVPAVAIDAAVLLRAEWDKFCDEVWLIDVPESEAIRRIMFGRGLSEQEARSRLFAQSDNRPDERMINVVVNNVGSVDDLRKRVGSLWAERIAMKD